MSGINWGRVLAGGLVAAVLSFFSDGFLHEMLVGADWKAVYAHLGVPEPAHGGEGIPYFAIFDLGRGLVPLVVYAALP